MMHLVFAIHTYEAGLIREISTGIISSNVMNSIPEKGSELEGELLEKVGFKKTDHLHFFEWVALRPHDFEEDENFERFNYLFDIQDN